MSSTGTGPAIAGLEGRLGYTILVPDSWYELDLHPATREESIRRLVSERLDDPEQRGGLQRLLLEQARQARDSGATYCASFSFPTDAGPVTGSVMVSLHDDPADGDLEVLGEAFRPVPRQPAVEGSEVDLEPWTDVAPIEIGGRRAVRSSGISDTPLGEGRWLRNVSMVTVVPLPEHRRAFMITCSSPVVALADDLLDLFDAVTDSFRVVSLDDSAPLEER